MVFEAIVLAEKRYQAYLEEVGEQRATSATANLTMTNTISSARAISPTTTT